MADVLSKKKRILIDGRFIGIGDSMSRYTLELVKGYLQLGSDFEFTLLVRPQGKEIAEQFLSDQLSVNSIQALPDNRKPKTENLIIKVLDVPHYSLSEQTKLLRFLKKNKFDLVHFIQFNHPVRYRGKFVVTVHDLTLFGHLYRKSRIKALAFHQVMKSAVKNSAKIITISKTSKAAIVENYEVDPKKIEVTYLGVDEKYNSNLRSQISKIKEIKAKYRIGQDYILYTGMWKRHKNIIRMLKAFEQYKLQNSNSELQMVLAGKIDQNEPEVIDEITRINSALCHPALDAGSSTSADSGLRTLDSTAILATGFVDEVDLPYLYAGALAYCIPSLSEGFGLPPLEAMAVGTPVISSNVSAMPEILGDAPIYFDPYGIRDIEKAINRIVIDEKCRAGLSKKGIEQSKKYSWAKTAKETLDIYKTII